MAKIVLGALAAQASGKIGGVVFSHNRYGAYVRTKAKPTVSQSTWAMEAKNNLANVSRSWGELNDAQRESWYTWAANNPIMDRVGNSQILAGNAAYTMLNGRLGALGQPLIDLPPVKSAPAALLTAEINVDIGAGTFNIVFTETPGAADTALYVQAAITEKDSEVYVKNKLKLLGISSSPATSPVTAIAFPDQSAGTIKATLALRFGTLQVGQFVTYYLSVMDTANGLLSTPYVVSGNIVSTP